MVVVDTKYRAKPSLEKLIGIFCIWDKAPSRPQKLTMDVEGDLKWILAILHHQHRFYSILVEYFVQIQQLTVHVFMDVSDTGICVLEPQLKQFIRAQFDEATRDMFASSKEQNSIMCAN
ncbi:hypothetical protein PHPALM_28414 [Phytophthora palmivora]|uniref:Uncharacterized protein n=1 Tax=Phytophthora palmivora TaxID=4796 RepID=A0A2P4XA54_9STRA|nr:hypothetical protein PHPALM_28414 [Phytophthora palmivora]